MHLPLDEICRKCLLSPLLRRSPRCYITAHLISGARIPSPQKYFPARSLQLPILSSCTTTFSVRIMALDSTALLQLVLSLAWTCLSDTPVTQKHPYFTRFITSQAVLEEIASVTSLFFAPGLFEALEATAPPTIQYFKTLPTEPTKSWAVYLLVFEKPNHRPRIYIGSGTASSYGVSVRFYHYDHQYTLPTYVQKALDEGYTIVHKGLLCWASIPTPSLQPRIRLLFLAIEAALSFAFWTMRTTKNDYGMAHICPWPVHNIDALDSFEYDGCCSHCCLNEGIVGDFGLSAEDLEAQAIQKKEIRAVKQAVRNANYHYKQMATNRDEYLDEMELRKRNHRAQNIEKHRERERNHNAKHKANKTYYCELCKVACHKKSDLEVHNNTRKHLVKANDLATKRHKCLPCAYATDRLSSYNDHLKSKRHLKEMAALSSSELD